MSSITESLEKSEIKNIDAVVLTYLISKYSNVINWIGLFYLVLFISVTFMGGDHTWLIAISMFLPAIVGIANYVYIMRQAQHIFMKQVAYDLNFTYSDKGDVSSLDQIFNTSNIYAVEDILTGSYNNLPARIFNCMLKMSHGKDMHANVNTVFEIELDSNFPTIAVLEKTNPQNMFNNLQDMKTLQLEGDFSKYFTVWIQKDAQLELYEILTPDVMKDIEDLINPLNILFISNKLYIFSSSLITSKSEFITIDHLISHLLTQWLPIIKSVREAK